MAADIKTCNGDASLFVDPTQSGTLTSGSGIFTPNAGDTANIDLSFSTPLYVPLGTGAGPIGVGAYDIAFDFLFAYNGVMGYVPLSNSSQSSTVTGYSGPIGLNLSESTDDYLAYVGFGGVISNPAAFSITGIDSTFDFVQGSTDPIISVVYGYQVTVPEPATWAIMLVGFGGLGAVMRTQRRRRAFAAL